MLLGASCQSQRVCAPSPDGSGAALYLTSLSGAHGWLPWTQISLCSLTGRSFLVAALGVARRLQFTSRLVRASFRRGRVSRRWCCADDGLVVAQVGGHR